MNKLKKIMNFSLIFCLILFLTGCSKARPEESINTIKELKFEKLRSVRIGITSIRPAGLNQTVKIYEFDFKNPNQRYFHFKLKRGQSLQASSVPPKHKGDAAIGI